jgi:hypothetical protein
MIRPLAALGAAMLLTTACASAPTKISAAPVQTPSFLRAVGTGESNRFGNPLIRVEMYAEGQLQGSVLAVSGRAHTQNRNRHIAGTEAPLPDGLYTVDNQVYPSTNPQTAGQFLPIWPQFPTGRTELGFHLDPSYNIDPKEDGTQGCIGFTTAADRAKLFGWISKHKPRYLEVNLSWKIPPAKSLSALGLLPSRWHQYRH